MGFTFEESINEDDTKVEKDNVMLLIDPMSLQYLTGAEIDYQGQRSRVTVCY
jgi:iron-sulfur cluster insertion protein